MTDEAVVTLHVPARDVALVQVLMRLIEDDCLPADLHFDAESSRYSLDVAGERAVHLLELIDLGAGTRGSESFSERLVRLSMQHPLPFGDQR